MRASKSLRSMCPAPVCPDGLRLRVDTPISNGGRERRPERPLQLLRARVADDHVHLQLLGSIRSDDSRGSDPSRTGPLRHHHGLPHGPGLCDLLHGAGHSYCATGRHPFPARDPLGEFRSLERDDGLGGASKNRPGTDRHPDWCGHWRSGGHRARPLADFGLLPPRATHSGVWRISTGRLPGPDAGLDGRRGPGRSGGLENDLPDRGTARGGARPCSVPHGEGSGSRGLRFARTRESARLAPGRGVRTPVAAPKFSLLDDRVGDCLLCGHGFWVLATGALRARPRDDSHGGGPATRTHDGDQRIAGGYWRGPADRPPGPARPPLVDVDPRGQCAEFSALPDRCVRCPHCDGRAALRDSFGPPRRRLGARRLCGGPGPGASAHAGPGCLTADSLHHPAGHGGWSPGGGDPERRAGPELR